MVGGRRVECLVSLGSRQTRSRAVRLLRWLLGAGGAEASCAAAAATGLRGKAVGCWLGSSGAGAGTNRSEGRELPAPPSSGHLALFGPAMWSARVSAGGTNVSMSERAAAGEAREKEKGKQPAGREHEKGDTKERKE